MRITGRYKETLKCHSTVQGRMEEWYSHEKRSMGTQVCVRAKHLRTKK